MAHYSPSKDEFFSRAVIDAVVKARPHTIRGIYVQSCTLSLTMSPPVRVDMKEFAI